MSLIASSSGASWNVISSGVNATKVVVCAAVVCGVSGVRLGCQGVHLDAATPVLDEALVTRARFLP